ncbi:hypothetical protein FCR2A7T_05880 [Flavobacterium cauense R2A-7]|nr:hypothetical protein FCR2A7T_05880 [Flavobacterium cauense R2A-7]
MISEQYLNKYKIPKLSFQFWDFFNVSFVKPFLAAGIRF